MHPKSLKWLDDIVDAGTYILEITADASADNVRADRGLRQTVERNLITIGEALRRLELTDPALVSRIVQYRLVIGFRNRLVHEYDDIDIEQMWEAIKESLPVLVRQTRELVDAAE